VGTRVPGDELDPPRLPTVEAIVGAERVFASDPSYGSLLARFLEDLGRFTGVDGVHAERRAIEPDEAGAMQITVAGGRVQFTCRAPGASTTDAAALVADLNSYLLGGRRRKLHLYRIDAYNRGFVLASPEEVRELRRCGYLIESWRVAWAIEKLDRAGIELGRFERGAWDLERLLRRMLLLGAGLEPIEAEIERGRRGAIVLRLRGHEQLVVRTSRLPREEPLHESLRRVLPRLNRLLARAGSDWRWLHHEGRYLHRVVLAPRPWAALFAELFERAAASLEAGFGYDGAAVLPLAHPLPDPALELPRLYTPADLLPRRRIHETDFKCSARSSDYPELLVELARFAGVELEVEPVAQADQPAPGHYTVRATYRGEHRAIVMADRKYADASPMLEYLNELLAAARRRFRLHLFHSPNEGGVVLVSDEEARKLRAAAYL
jgi:hypothetical protein